MNSWREQQKLALSEQLYEVALSLFEEMGYDQASVVNICSRVGVAKGTFFNYFSSKEAVLSRYMESITAIALENSRRQHTGECEKDVLQTLLNLFAEARKSESIFHTVCRIVPHYASLREDEEKLDADIASLLAELIEAGKASNQLLPDLESDVLVPLLLSTLTATAHEWAADPDNFNPEKEIARRVRFLFRAAKPVQVTS